MKIPFECPKCGRQMETEASNAGKQRMCPGCGRRVTIPGETTSALQVAPAAALPAPAQARERATQGITVPSAQKGKGSKPLVAVGIAAGVLLLAVVLYMLFFSGSPAITPGGETAGVHGQGADGTGETKPGWPPQVKVESARMTRSSESLTYPWSGTFRVWSLRLVLRNTGRSNLILSNLCILLESNSDESSYEGMVQMRTSSEEREGLFESGVNETAKHFVVYNAQRNDEDNDALFQKSGTMITFTTRSSDTPIDPSFGTIRAGERFVLCLEFKLGTMLKDEFLSTVKFVSPILQSAGASEDSGVILVIDFKRPGTESHEGDWPLASSTELSLDFDSLAGQVKDSKSTVITRVIAVNYLANIYGKRAAGELQTRLLTVNEAKGEVRAAAIQALGRIKDGGSVAKLCEIASDSEQAEGLRNLAAAMLGTIGSTSAIEVLTRCALHGEDNLSESAISALGNIGGPAAIEALSKMVRDENFELPAAAASALGDCGSLAVPVLAKTVKDKPIAVAKAAVRALGKLLKREDIKAEGSGEESRIKYTEQLRGAEPAMTGASARTSINALAGALLDKRDDVAKAAVDTLVDVPGTRASQALLVALDRETEVVVELIKAVSRRREPEAPEHILKYLQPSARSKVVKAAIDAAVNLNIGRAEAKLKELAGKGGKSVRCKAVEAMGELKAVGARALLAQILSDTSEPEDLREKALSALMKLPGGCDEHILRKIGANKEDTLRWKCLEHLCNSDSDMSLAVVRLATKERDDSGKWRRDRLKEKLDQAQRKLKYTSLAERLTALDVEERRRAADEIEEKKDRSALPALKKAVAAERDCATLWRFCGAIEALECRDIDLVPPLLARLRSDDKALARAAAGVLRYITGLHNGPYKQENEAEIAEDIREWEKWWESR